MGGMKRVLRIAAALWFVPTLWIAGCSDSGEPAGPPDVYTVRGVIAALPDPADPFTQLKISHEAIPDFKTISGQVVGMNAMTMGFTPGPGVSLEGLAVGQKVEFVLEVHREKAAMLVTSIEPLPEDTALELAAGGGDEAGDEPGSAAEHDDHAGHDH